MTNCAEVADANEEDADSTPGNLSDPAAGDEDDSECVSADVPQALPALTLVKAVEDKDGLFQDANAAPGPVLPAGTIADFQYTVTNTGNTDLTNIRVVDDRGITVTCPPGTLAVGDDVICTGSGSIGTDQYTNTGTASGDYRIDAQTVGTVTDDDPANVFGSDPSVTIEKTVEDVDGDPQPADAAPGVFLPAGSTATFHYTVTNTGNTALSSIVVVDDHGLVVSCPATTLPVGGHLVCDASGPIGTGQYTNVGTVTGEDPAGTEVTDDDPANVFGSDPSVTIEKTVEDVDGDPQPADAAPGVYLPAGSTATFHYTVTNTGNTALSSIVVVDDHGLVVSCPASTLAAGDDMECDASGPIGFGQYTNVGTVNGEDPAGTEVTDDDPANAFGSDPSVTIDKSVADGTGAYQPADAEPGVYLPAGSTAHFQYRVTNTGNAVLVNIEVTDDRGVVVSCPQTTLAAGAFMICTGDGLIGTGQYTNIGTVTGEDPTGAEVDDDDPANVFGSDSGIAIVKDIRDANGVYQSADTAPGAYLPEGTDASFRYTVTNTGNTVLTNVTVTDDQGVDVTCPKTTLAVDEHMECFGTGPIGIGQYTNVGTATGEDPTGDTLTTSNPANAFGSDPSVTIEKDLLDGSGTYQPADTAPGAYLPADTVASFRYTVKNTGNTVLTNLVVTDDKGVDVDCDKTTLTPGESMTCTGSGPIGDGQYTNIGTVTGDDPAGTEVTDDNPANVFGSDSGIAIEKSVLDGAGVYQPADTAPGVYRPKGSTATFRYRVTNTGNTTLTNIEVTDDQGVEVSCPETTLAPGAVMACFGSGPIGTGQYTNVGTVTGEDPEGTSLVADNPANVYGSDSGIAIEKSVLDGADTYQPADTAPGVYLAKGSTATFRYRVTNTGNTPLASIDVTDDRGVEVTCPETSLAAGEHMDCFGSGPIGTGQYTNVGTVTGEDPDGTDLVADNPANVFGSSSGVTIVKDIQDADGTWRHADAAPGVTLPPGTVATFRYLVTNTGTTRLTGVVVTDDRGVKVTCPQSALDPGEAMTCTGSGSIGTGRYTNVGTVTASDPFGTMRTASNPANATSHRAPTPAPPRSGYLPRTGGGWLLLISVGSALVTAGAWFLVLGRRRRAVGP